ncbi:CpsD/CapB family tyrosine-protein kinase [Paenibacillus thermoaerophilus]|uniref:non-specific protein-tyrosine kinase n=1 Tax=Paenibacillus thermoaerophilus TaxID=1215385 RepID=A0ABW2V468_9BACL|nr:CpsD/CapB family tyrosine-protein kinase [Paenibacillus thermoaerophilus]TMV16167.1 CpsD/CapB family tyrosine-protein kinase [Paenibacillus thermoaerophilus]
MPRDNAAVLVTDLNDGVRSVEDYKVLRTNLEYEFLRKGSKVLLVNSMKPAEGKTATAANLAIVFAQAGRNVLLVDGNLRKPALHDVFRRLNHRGLSDALAGYSDPMEIVQPTEFAGLDLVSGGTATPSPTELLASEKACMALESWKAHYDLILIDSPAAESRTDAMIAAGFSDGVLLVIKHRTVKPEELLSWKHGILRAGANLVGFAYVN